MAVAECHAPVRHNDSSGMASKRWQHRRRQLFLLIARPRPWFFLFSFCSSSFPSSRSPTLLFVICARPANSSRPLLFLELFLSLLNSPLTAVHPEPRRRRFSHLRSSGSAPPPPTHMASPSLWVRKRAPASVILSIAVVKSADEPLLGAAACAAATHLPGIYRRGRHGGISLVAGDLTAGKIAAGQGRRTEVPKVEFVELAGELRLMKEVIKGGAVAWGPREGAFPGLSKDISGLGLNRLKDCGAREGEPSSSLDTEHDMHAAFVVSGDNSEAAGRGPVGEGVVKELEEGWGGPSLVRKVTFKAFLLAGTPRV
ncbi:hypothetical protein HU200_036390 [Digitaria exilis]|uniref:Uncharacterized protein n=1 Tax=Digitaria exilis TaxID=1010633 RepID=A0A835BFS1_9POAL|nr:hypothetical protein HU200_036390 [Digitaria exilis]